MTVPRFTRVNKTRLTAPPPLVFPHLGIAHTMRRTPDFLPAFLALLPAALAAQSLPSRVSPYLFSAGVEDARALWVNPAGLGILPVASLYGEVSMDRDVADAWGLRQYNFGLASRGFAVSYQHDHFETGGSSGRWRVGGAVPLGRRTAVGVATTFYHPDRGYDIGLRVSPIATFDIGMVIRQIGRPVVEDSAMLPVTEVFGMTWRPRRFPLGLSGEVVSTERLPASGHDMTYRAGATLTLRGRTPIGALVAFDFGNGFRVERWNLGVTVGLQAQALLVGTAVPGTSAALDGLSLTGLTQGPITARRR
jgi:hypothetical protein